MPNTNYQTIFQMGQAINDMVKQATGRDVVQTIEMGQVTVAQNHIYTKHTYSGDVVSFVTNDEYPMQIVADINPVQEGTGDPSPENVRPITGWTGAEVTRTGKNLFDKTAAVYGAINSDGTVSSNVSKKVSDFIPVAPGVTYYVTNVLPATDGRGVFWYDGNKGSISVDKPNNNNYETSGIITAPQNARYVRIGVHSESVDTCQLEIGSTATDYEPYQGAAYPITFPTSAGTVYGGTLSINKDVTTVLSIEWANIASYDGEELPGEWISDRDVYEEGTTPTTGAQVVYELAEPVTYTITDIDIIKTIAGENNVWADTGNITVSYDEITEGGGV